MEKIISIYLFIINLTSYLLFSSFFNSSFIIKETNFERLILELFSEAFNKALPTTDC